MVKKRERKSMCVCVLRACSDVIKMLCVPKWFMDSLIFNGYCKSKSREFGWRDAIGSEFASLEYFVVSSEKCQRLAVCMNSQRAHIVDMFYFGIDTRLAAIYVTDFLRFFLVCFLDFHLSIRLLCYLTSARNRRRNWYDWSLSRAQTAIETSSNTFHAF